MYVVTDARGRVLHGFEKTSQALARWDSPRPGVAGRDSVDSRGVSGNFDALIHEPAMLISHSAVRNRAQADLDDSVHAGLQPRCLKIEDEI